MMLDGPRAHTPTLHVVWFVSALDLPHCHVLSPSAVPLAAGHAAAVCRRASGAKAMGEVPKGDYHSLSLAARARHSPRFGRRHGAIFVGRVTCWPRSPRQSSRRQSNPRLGGRARPPRTRCRGSNMLMGTSWSTAPVTLAGVATAATFRHGRSPTTLPRQVSTTASSVPNPMPVRLPPT